MRIDEIRLRDPYILAADGIYYMYGSRAGNGNEEDAVELQTGLDVYKSKDLISWTEGKSLFGTKGYYKKDAELWAPEVYRYRDKYYMFVTIKRYNKNQPRGTYVFVCDTPDGEFKPHSSAPITPPEWECLDGTLFIENGKPYMVFCHEWRQVTDGEFCVIEMDENLERAVGEPKVLFTASEAEWSAPIDKDIYVSDGPFLFKEDGVLYMIWSSFTEQGYAVGISCSESGSIMGKWKHCSEFIYNDDGGHAMLFKTFDEKRKLICHSPNDSITSAPRIYDFIRKDKGNYTLLKQAQ